MIDLIAVLPDTIQFPLFMDFLHKNRSRFEKVIIVWSKSNWELPDITEFFQQQLTGKDVTFIWSDSVNGSSDWRDVATKKGLELSTSEWVMFMEPDFTPKGFHFWKAIEETLESYDLAYVNIEKRMHPCCLLMKRKVLEKTSRDFSANPPHWDHFGKIQIDLEKDTPPLKWHNLPNYTYTHLGGLTRNMYLLQTGEEPNYKLDEFKKYLEDCFKSKVDLTPEFIEVVTKYLGRI